MAPKAVFAGLVVDEGDRPVEVTVVGEEAFYVVDDGGFLRHIDSQTVDRQVLDILRETMESNETQIREGVLRLSGQEDIFSRAVLEKSLKDPQARLGELLATGLPEEVRAWLGMMGFKVVVDVHGKVLRVDQPSRPEVPPEGTEEDL